MTFRILKNLLLAAVFGATLPVTAQAADVAARGDQ